MNEIVIIKYVIKKVSEVKFELDQNSTMLMISDLSKFQI